jgi:hypothetical protein
LQSVEFERYQAGSLHEAGHAVLASILDRELIELSILTDEYGNGYLLREKRENTAEEIVEEVAIALAGEEAPYLWDQGWITNAEHDYRRIYDLLGRNLLPIGFNVEAVRSCVKQMLPAIRDSVAAVGELLSKQKKLAGRQAQLLISVSPQVISSFRDCLQKTRVTEYHEQP